jgi:hypothetical protein
VLLVCGIGLWLAASAGAVPKPPPAFWGAARCERVVLGVYGYASHHAPGGFALPTGDGHAFHVAQAICVGHGTAHECRWTAGRQARLYSVFTVLARSPLDGGVVRSFTLATRTGDGRVKITHHAGDQYAGWPADFYMSRVELLATGATPRRFHSIARPIVSMLEREEKATGCAGA